MNKHIICGVAVYPPCVLFTRRVCAHTGAEIAPITDTIILLGAFHSHITAAIIEFQHREANTLSL